MDRIPATIGLLTYNSEEHLARALESVRDFADVIIADGGSTDRTLSIAADYGARVISQTNPGHPITDFAKERNQLLAAAKERWFFYLDSDEILSSELAAFIRKVATDAEEQNVAYRVRYLKTTPDGTRPYRTYREYYQIRLVRTDIGARFVRPVHERIELPEGAKVGQTEAPWYVPFEDDEFSIRVMLPKLWERTGMEAALWQPRGLGNAFAHVIGIPLVRIAKALFKMVAVPLRYGREALPIKYEVIRIIYTTFLSFRSLERLLRGR